MKKRAYEEDERMQAVQVKKNKMNSHGTTVFCNLCKGERSVLLIFLVFVFFFAIPMTVRLFGFEMENM